MTLANSLMGKTLPNYASNDSGILNDSESCDTPKSLKTSKALKTHIDTTSSTKNKIYVEHTVQSPGSLSTSPNVENQSFALTRIAEEKDEIDFNVIISYCSCIIFTLYTIYIVYIVCIIYIIYTI